METCFLGVDNGSTAVKAAVFDRHGRLLGRAGRVVAQQTPQPGAAERDMEQLWLDTAEVIRRAVRSAGVPAACIGAVGCTGHGKGAYLWGRDGAPVRPAILSTDTRAQAVLARWEQDGTARRARSRTLQRLLVSQPCVLLAWLKEQEPESYANIRWVFEAKDYIRFRLTGQARAERTDYSGTGLMDLRTGRFERALLDCYGIPEMEACLPPTAESQEICGRVDSGAAALTGLAEGTPVIGGMFDIDACALAAGVTDGRELCVIAGTWSINEYISRSPAPQQNGTMNSLFCMPGYYLVEQSSPTSAGNLEWLVQSVLSCDRERAEQAGESAYAFLDRMVEQTPPERNGPIFLPYLFGAPDIPQASAAFWGIAGRHGKADLVRAVFEGIAFSHLWHVERLLEGRSRPEGVRLSGGAANSRVWVQMFADVLGLPVQASPGKEPGALGCAIACAVALGIYPDWQTAVRQMAPRGVRTLPDRAAGAVYREKYLRSCRLRQALEPLWREMG